ncbi:MAG: hypothetical protein CVV47_02150 [Spirochaetae bacterium HGW-Spirochaetae-3]|jgi:AraC-like DNA-binding protein|nr:MAG: hypothetical protein CVV47_02150 [Spirochaetae bacterium HGW-Spirochaetae-3]
MISISRNERIHSIEWKRGEDVRATRVHAHAAWSLGIVCSGSTTASFGRKRLRLERGDYLAVPPGTLHLCDPDTESGFSYSTLYVGAEYSGLFPTSFGCIFSGAVDTSAADSLCERFIACRDARELAEILDRLATLLDSGLARLLEPVATIRFDVSIDDGAPSRNDRYKEYRSSLRAYGAGSSSIHQTRRIETAKALLRSGAAVVDAAMECGYYDQSHFDKAFRLYTGLTPIAYRAQTY